MAFILAHPPGHDAFSPGVPVLWISWKGIAFHTGMGMFHPNPPNYPGGARGVRPWITGYFALSKHIKAERPRLFNRFLSSGIFYKNSSEGIFFRRWGQRTSRLSLTILDFPMTLLYPIVEQAICLPSKRLLENPAVSTL
jgi:hypothetical protein